MSKVTTILLAVILDLLFGDPPNRYHPVVAMGHWLRLGRRYAPHPPLGGPGGQGTGGTGRNHLLFGAGWVLAGIGLFTLPLQRMNRYLGHFALLEAMLLKPMFAYRNLRRAVAEVEQALTADDLPEARRLLSWHLVSRDTTSLTEAEVIGATMESLAENLTDSLTTPLSAYALGGLPATWSYRLVNTADAMWGYRTPELEQLGKFPARLDDLLNWLPARLTGWLLVLATWLAGEDATNAAKTMLSQHRRTASPNAGWTMSAMAGACRVTLDKRGVYSLAGGNEPLTLQTLGRALRVADLTAGLIIGLACLLSLVSQRLKEKLSCN